MSLLVRVLGCLLCLLLFVRGWAEERRVFVPVVGSAAASQAACAKALAAGRCFAVEIKHGARGTVIAGGSETPLAPGRYRAHVLLAMRPIGDIDVSALGLSVSAGGTSRAVTMLHFAKADEFIDVPVDFTVTREGDVPVTVSWNLTGERANFNHQQALKQRQAVDPDEEENLDVPAATAKTDAEGMIATADLATLPYHLAACGLHFEALSPLEITAVTANKIVYKPTEQGTATVTLRNAGADPVKAALTVELATGLEGMKPVATATLELAPGETKTWTGPFNVADLYWGSDLRATARVGDGPATMRRFTFGVTKNYWETALVSGMMFSRDYREPAAADVFMQRIMDQGYTGLESGFWAPDEFGDFTPDPVRDIFFGGQHCYPGSVKGTKNVIAAGHQRGMFCSVYSNLWGGDGWDGWEMIRKHPDWAWGGSNTFSDALENWELMYTGKVGNFAYWPYTCITGERTDATLPVHARELVNTKRELGWDGVRYDSYDAEGEWNINCTETVRRLTEKDEPDYMWGYNSSVPKNVTARALDVMCRGGALVMEEGLRGAGKQPSSITAYLTTLAGYRDKVWAHGGHLGICYDRPMATLTYGGSVVDELYLSASLLAAGAHPYYGVIENTLGQHARFALRYSEFIYNNTLRELANPDAVVRVPATAKLLALGKLAKTLDLGGDRHRLVIHLLNAPANDMTQQNFALALPAPLRNLPVTVTLPVGAKVTGAWSLCPVPDARHEAVAASMKENTATVTVPEVRVWNVLVVDFTAKEGLPTTATRATGTFATPAPAPVKPAVTPVPDAEVAQKKGIVPPVEWIFPVPRPLRVLGVHGAWYPEYGLDRAYARLGGALCTDTWASVFSLRNYPDSYEELMRYHLVVVGNVNAGAFTPVQRAMLERYVAAGGALLFLGGKTTFGPNFRNTAFAEMAPVTFGDTGDLRSAPDGLPLAPGPQAWKGLAKLAWAQAPRVFWYHMLTPKPEAQVRVTAEGKPLLITGTYGKGRVAVFAGSVMGDPAADKLPCWAWDGWAGLLAETITWLCEPLQTPAPPGKALLEKMQADLLAGGVKKASAVGPAIARFARVPATPATAQALLKAIAQLDGEVPLDLVDTVWDSARPYATADSDETARLLLDGSAGAKISLGLRICGQIKAADARATLEAALKGPDGGGPEDPDGNAIEDTAREEPEFHAYIVRLGALEGLGNLGDPAALPALRAAIKQYRMTASKPAEFPRIVTQADELYQEALLSALRCGDATAAGPVVDLLLENRYVVIRMMAFLDSPDYPGPEHEATRREKRRIIRELPRASARQARLYAKLGALPAGVLPALAQRLAAEEDTRVASIAFAIFGSGFRGESSIPPAALTTLRGAKVAAVRGLAP